MKNIKLIFGVLIGLFMACTVPTETDFESITKPLQHNELISAWRFPTAWHWKESLLKADQEDEVARMNEAMKPIASQIIPRIFKDAKEGKLTIYESKTPENLEGVPITDLLQRMKEPRFFGANWNNVETFQKAIHIVQRRKDDHKGFSAEEIKLEIISADPKGKASEKYFGFVFVSDLVRLNYKVKLAGKNYDFLSYLDHAHQYAYPIYYRNHQMTEGLQSLVEAFGTKDRVLNGEWKNITWLNGRPNLTPYRFQPLLSEQLDKYVGKYKLSKDSETIYVDGVEAEVRVIKERNYLKILWPDESPFLTLPHIYSMDETRFFTLVEESIQFTETADNQIQFLVTHKPGHTTSGIKY